MWRQNQKMWEKNPLHVNQKLEWYTYNLIYFGYSAHVLPESILNHVGCNLGYGDGVEKPAQQNVRLLSGFAAVNFDETTANQLTIGIDGFNWDYRPIESR